MKLTKIFCLGAVAMSLNGVCQVTITELVWTDAVTASQATNKYLDSIPIGQVGVWIKAQCDSSTFKTISSEGFVRYKWFKKAGAGWTSKGVDRPDDVFLIGQDSITDSVAVNNVNNFYWSSWCLRRRSKMSEGMWKIVITKANNSKLAEAEIIVTGNDE